MGTDAESPFHLGAQTGGCAVGKSRLNRYRSAHSNAAFDAQSGAGRYLGYRQHRCAGQARVFNAVVQGGIAPVAGAFAAAGNRVAILAAAGVAVTGGGKLRRVLLGGGHAIAALPKLITVFFQSQHHLGPQRPALFGKIVQRFFVVIHHAHKFKTAPLKQAAFGGFHLLATFHRFQKTLGDFPGLIAHIRALFDIVL